MSGTENVTETIEWSDDHQGEISHGSLIVLGAGESFESLVRARPVTLVTTLEIGRRPVAAPDRDVLVLADRTVSSRHAMIRGPIGVADSFTIEDLGSLNGTYVDGQRIKGSVGLRNGAIVFLGSQVGVFRVMTQSELKAIELDGARPFAPVATLSPELARVTLKLRQLAPSTAEILLVGETGVGKEVFARAIHAASGCAGRFIAVNCAALPAALVESELFGYEKGAHSTAHVRKPGLIASASGGTLFLDEIGDMPADLQAKLLRFAQDRRFRPLGSTEEIESDARIIAATSRTVLGPSSYVHEALVARLGAEPIVLPPLRDRMEDLGGLVAQFAKQASGGALEKTVSAERPLFQPEAFQALFLHRWPRNVRELAKVIGEATQLSSGRSIEIQDLPDSVTTRIRISARGVDESENWDGPPTRLGAAREPGQSGGLPDTAPGVNAESEKRRIMAALADCGGNQSRAARLLGMSRRALMMRLDRYGIPRPQKGAK